jgi:ferredoxin
MRILSERTSIGGRCQWCRRHIAQGETVSKMDDGRRRRWSTNAGGPGSWVCVCCADVAEHQLALFDMPHGERMGS